MIAYYPMLKHLHMTLALVSLLLFLYRWSLALAGSGRLQQKWLKVLPHINDTFLLLFGVLLAVTLQMSPGQQPWLLAKLIALVIYIGLGVMALKRPACPRPEAGGRGGRSRSIRLHGGRSHHQISLVLAGITTCRGGARPSPPSHLPPSLLLPFPSSHPGREHSRKACFQQKGLKQPLFIVILFYLSMLCFFMYENGDSCRSKTCDIDCRRPWLGYTQR